ncbi:hypothetical protein QBC40DRAFT_308320 [Triangularia verruculosa]|uniref:Zn(2)-C6 fungal-type domain-containing protein n=1 Tax=Triangularia verruculosa TaxID=2587418 RepID=A0AAN6XGV5_9PEZI|nr:hypothetical protein QBC40DRAFT_308320 [Triangularia verruculosa]
MAQYPESSQLRLQSSLDSNPVKPPRVLPNINTLDEHHQSLPAQPPHQLPQLSQPSQHHHPRYWTPPPAQAQAQIQAQAPPPSQTSQPVSLPVHTSTSTINGEGRGGKSEKAARGSPSVKPHNTHSHASSASTAATSTVAAGAAENSMHEVRGGQYEARYSGDAPMLTASMMSNTQPLPGPPRQPVSYGSSMPYPSAGMPPSSHYPYPPQAVPPADPYRPTPTSLPSMRTLDHGHGHGHGHGQPQPPPQQHPQHGMALGGHMAAQMVPGPSGMGYHYLHPHVYGLPDPSTGMRFAIPPGLAADPRIAMSGGRHKKEIKRRTKTGCLTCRKRRIKCDEGHPTCNNCKKSKRECLGYDPIFKQQPGPTAIQPAPSGQQQQQPQQPPTPSTLASPAPTVLSSSTAHSYPPTTTASYPPPPASSVAFDSSASATPQSVKTDQQYDYSAAIDPALQGAEASNAPALHYQQHIKAEGGISQVVGDKNNLRGGTPSSPSTLPALAQTQSREIMSAHTSFPAKKMKVDELIGLGGPFPPAPSSPPSPELLDEMTKLYYEVYVPGLTLFFETQWYDIPKDRVTAVLSAAILPNGQPLNSLFASFIESISKIHGTDPANMVTSGHLETHVIWALARLPLLAASGSAHPPPTSSLPGPDSAEACGRLQIFETLISGGTLDNNPYTPPATNMHQPRRSELEFWYHLAQYLLSAHASPSAASTREHLLGLMRSLLDGRENRDVLYSIAVLREFTARWDAGPNEQNVGAHLEESDPRSKLAVATRFIRDEATSTGGTTNVVRRLADLAYRAFVRPGVNVNKSGRGV